MKKLAILTALCLSATACQSQKTEGTNTDESSSEAGTSEATNSDGDDTSTTEATGSNGSDTTTSETEGDDSTDPTGDDSTDPQESTETSSETESGGSTDDTGDSTQDTGSDTTTSSEEPLFSFFVTSLEIMRELSGSEDGFGGDLGGLEGADSICQRTAEKEGFKTKTWRAFLSVTKGPDGNPVNAIDRIGEGPWYDRNGRLIAMNKEGLLHDRPDGDAQSVADLPNERGEAQEQFGDNHDVVTGTNKMGQLFDTDPESTCLDWTSIEKPKSGTLMGGHSWPAQSGKNWMQAHPLHGCAPGVNLVQDGPGMGDCIGCGGGYGGIYCFALTP